VLHGGVKRAATAVLIAAVLAGCGGGGNKHAATTAPPAHEPAPTATPTTPSPQSTPTATTNTPPTEHRTTPQSSTQPLKVTSPYRCNGKPLRAISAAGPVTVKPAIVKPGQSFTVTVTDPSAKVAVVSLAGVAPKPIQASAKPNDDHVAATLKMPSYASCGNKLLEVEGDVSAEAYVGVAH
jgi:hypothetical protein